MYMLHSWIIFFLNWQKKVRRRNFYDPPSPHIEQYRILNDPSPPKKVRRLLWTAPKEDLNMEKKTKKYCYPSNTSEQYAKGDFWLSIKESC